MFAYFEKKYFFSALWSSRGGTQWVGAMRRRSGVRNRTDAFNHGWTGYGLSAVWDAVGLFALADAAGAFFLFDGVEDVGGVGDIEDGEVQAAIGVAFVGGLKLAGDAGAGAKGKVFDGADADFDGEDGNEQAVFIHVQDEDAEFFALLINAVEILLMNKVGNGLVGEIGAGSEGGDGGEVELLGLAEVGDEEAALVNDERGGGFAAAEQIVKRAVELFNVLFDELWERGHGSRGLRGGGMLADEFVEQHAGDHVEGLEDAFALVRGGGERGYLELAVVEEELHVVHGGDIGQVLFVVLEDVRDVRHVELQG